MPPKVDNRTTNIIHHLDRPVRCKIMKSGMAVIIALSAKEICVMVDVVWSIIYFPPRLA